MSTECAECLGPNGHLPLCPARPKGFDGGQAFHANGGEAAGTIPKAKIGRPKGFDGRQSRQMSALALAFKANGLDWKKDFSDAIKANRRERIKMWLRLLPYMITTSYRPKVRKWKGRPSKAAVIALETMEGRKE